MADQEAGLFKASPDRGAMLCFIGKSLMENRSGLIVQADLTRADGHADLHQMEVTPHVAQPSRYPARDGRTTRPPGDVQSQRCRKKIEEPFDWGKTVGGMAQTLYRGIERIPARFPLAMAACNFARLQKLLAT